MISIYQQQKGAMHKYRWILLLDPAIDVVEDVMLGLAK